MAKRSKGVLFLLLGILLLMTAGGWFVYNIAEDAHAGKQAADILSQFEEEPETDKTVSLITVDGNAFCGKIRIEKLGIELPIYDEWSDMRLKSAPCRYSGGVETNDMIVAAHNYKSHFGSLNKLRAGDEIAFTDAHGKIYLYEVRELATLHGTAVADMHAGGWDLTLFTCTKSGEQRVTARCERK